MVVDTVQVHVCIIRVHQLGESVVMCAYLKLISSLIFSLYYVFRSVSLCTYVVVMHQARSQGGYEGFDRPP